MKRVALLFFDVLLMACATILALLLRDNFEFSEPNFKALLPYLAVTLLTGAVIFSISGLSFSVWRSSSLNDYLKLAFASVITVLIAVGLCFSLTRLEGVARTVPVLQVMNMVFLLVAARLLIRLKHQHRSPAQFVGHPSPLSRTSVLIFGTTRLTELYLRSVAELARDKISVAGLISQTKTKVGRRFLGAQVLGTSEDLMKVLGDLEIHGIKVDKICVTMRYRDLTENERQQLASIELSTNIEIVYIEEAILSFAATGGHKDRDANATESTDATFNIAEDQLAAAARRPFWRLKRAFDVVLVGFLAVLLAPVILCVALLAAVDVGLPIVFWQQRPGVRGLPFRLYKLRTMAAAHDSGGQRIADDDRSSAIGRFLRRTRLDELPQLFNILIGDMSFVGPRPLLPDDQPVGLAARTLVRPGLTGWAQVNGGRDILPADKIALDVWYIQNATLSLDVKIFARTAVMVALGEHVNRQAIRTAWSDLSSAGICKAFGPELADRLLLKGRSISSEPPKVRAA